MDTTSEAGQSVSQEPIQPAKQERGGPTGSSHTQHSSHNGWPGVPLHALIIGIDNYPRLVPLAAAISDSQRMVSFLISDLKVPKDHITTLYDQYASREAIINAFQMLQNNHRIRMGDPILIFFAGHGGLTDSPPEWKQKHGTNKIQVIFPYDYGLPIARTNACVNCIPDTTISGLLNQLAGAKGDNIASTVIFDSCHSASGTRDDLVHTGMRARSAEIQFAIPHDIDDDILIHSPLGSKTERGSEPLLCLDQASHVHIAACGSAQKAWENNGKGLFTEVLIDTLRRSRVYNITYENLIKSLPALPSQSPHCYGRNKNRILFDSRLDPPTKTFIPVTCVFGAGRYTLLLQAGEESGVTEHSLWDLHESATENSTPRARVIARLPEVLATYLDPRDRQDARWLDQLATQTSGRTEIRMYARRLLAGEGTQLKVWCSSQSLQVLLSTPVQNSFSNIHEFGYVIQRERNNADVELGVYPTAPPGTRLTPNSQVLFRLRDPTAEFYGVSELRNRKPVLREEIDAVLFAAARWKWNLHHTNMYPNHRTPQVEPMRMLKVATKTRKGREYLQSPTIIPESSRGLVEFVAKTGDLYGIELISRARSPLYIRLFYFDATDFSIGDLFGHSVARGPEDAVLPAGGRLVIGDGQDGGSPLKFTVSPGNRVELGHLKVFWCTGPLELSDIAQKSAFAMRPGMVGRAVGRAPPAQDWGTLSLTLVMKAA